MVKVVVESVSVCVIMRMFDVEMARVGEVTVVDREVLLEEEVIEDDGDKEVEMRIEVGLEGQDDEVVAGSQEQGSPWSVIWMTRVSTRRLLAKRRIDGSVIPRSQASNFHHQNNTSPIMWYIYTYIHIYMFY